MTAPITNFAGIGSGVNYQSIVNAIIQGESTPLTAMQNVVANDNLSLTAYQNYSGLIGALDSAAQALSSGAAFEGVSSSVSGATSSSGKTVLSATAASGAEPGSYAVQVLQTAQAEKLSGAPVANAKTALGMSGEFVINSKVVTVTAADTLTSLRDKINTANSGASPSGVSAAIVSDSATAQRLVLTSQTTGSSGINLIDGAQGVAQQLGWIDSTESIKHQTSAGAQSDAFASATSTIASQLGLTVVPGAQTVTVGGQSVTIDLGSDSLTTLATKLSALTGIQASVQPATVNGATRYVLDIRNTTSFTDAGNALEQLGVLTGGRSSITQQLQSGALTAGDASTPATGSTLLTNLWNGGSAANAQGGDTLSISGTRGDGTAVNFTYTIGAGSTVQDLVTALNGSNAFGGGTRPAVASVDAGGHIVLTDGASGGSALSLQIVANNQGGGRLDLGAFSTVSAGRARELVAGADAKFSVDGVAFTRSSNSVTDVIANTTLTLNTADPSTTATVVVRRDESGAESAMQGFVTAYNNIVDFVKQQETATTDGSPNPILYNDPVVRLALGSLSSSLLKSVAGAAPDMSIPGQAGVAFTSDGHLTLNSTKFQTAFNTRFTDLERLFKQEGTTTNPSLVYTTSTDASQPGTYDVAITQVATQAQVAGTGFSGTYSTSGTGDTMQVTDLASKAAATIQLTNGMTTAQIVDALNAAFTTPQAQVVQSSNALLDATGSAPATAATSMLGLHQPDGTSAGVAAGDTIGYSGTGPAGVSYSGTFTVATNSTVGDLVAQIQASVGTGATVSFTNGVLSVKSGSTGASSLSLALTPNNKGGGHLDFGSVAVTTTGHGPLSLAASVVGNQVQIAQSQYGSVAGITVAFSGDASATAQLGISAATVHGLDVQGTIGGYAATGSGRQLVGATGTPVDGLSVAYLGTATGDTGTVSFTEGAGTAIDRLLTSWSDPATGMLTVRQKALNTQIATKQQEIANFNARIAIRRQALLKEYLAMDTAVAQFRAQSSSFLAAVAGSYGTSSSSSSSSGNSTASNTVASSASGSSASSSSSTSGG